MQFRFKLPSFDVFTDHASIASTEMCSKIWFQETVEKFEELIE